MQEDEKESTEYIVSRVYSPREDAGLNCGKTSRCKGRPCIYT